MDKYKITVFTPTYNRQRFLKRLYESLCTQTYSDFEWLIVDDGSTDSTEEYIKKLIKSCDKFTINYIKQPNGGKHRAINKGIHMAKGELFLIVDSDDYLTNQALEKVVYWENTLKNEKVKFSGISGLRVKETGELIGTTFNGMYKDTTYIERTKYGITGDKSEVFYTEVMRKYPFPEFEGEKFLTEAVVWNRMAVDGYLMRWTNEPFYICEYREDGLTHQGQEKNKNNFEGFTLWCKEWLEYTNSWILKCKIIGLYTWTGRNKGMSYKALEDKLQVNRILQIGLYMMTHLYKGIQYIKSCLNKLRRKNEHTFENANLD
ncbi:LPS biosynthesis protein [Sporanaerobium hydrogeniformans]|uniref:LPS biosynthesis protein n=1 Tax=Sporanaerobium hydrogeniformans TaxID=3072179 RepID=A0AC61DBI4_9FIRM|nr:glycosyltransferase family A protein [Sporanaerobium hydrogeniformans]PHV70153.1 LPS biosynthesis protein [Sporanaerobium hydrogeniformans]